MEQRFIEHVAHEVNARPQQVAAAAALLYGGATVPFVARYRKEATGGLSDVQLEVIEKRRAYFSELAERRDAVLESVAGQGKLTPELEEAIRATTSKQELEDLYLPYRPRRRTRAQIARERGLEPLVGALLDGAADPSADPFVLSAPFVSSDTGVPDVDAALAGARDILAERLAETVENRARLRGALLHDAVLRVHAVNGKESDGAVYRDYFDHAEPAARAASHRILAILRGERDGVLLSELVVDDEREIERLAASPHLPLDTPCGSHLRAAAVDCYRRLLRPSVTNEVRAALRERAEAEAISVFRANLEALLLQPPLGQLPVMGLDPGVRTGCKLAVVDAQSAVVATAVIHPLASHAEAPAAARTVVELIRRHAVHAVAVGNGTGGRETEAFVRQAVREAGLDGVVVAIVPETGASVYSASQQARDELPDLDVTLRGAVSIARRLQDPLAELVKIEPRSLGVGQYQHDVDQRALASELDVTVESAVNRVGVELNTASAPLLRRVSGLGDRLARAVVAHRERHGAFTSRRALREVVGVGARTFELAAGFLRVRGGAHPLDDTAVHPERYPVVERMAAELGVSLAALVGDPEKTARLDLDRFADDSRGLGRFTLEDIREELARPGRDPRPEFIVPHWREDVRSLDDLESGMTVEGRVSNVTNFGAFVDIGVKRDGLVHVSELSHRWVDDPRELVRVGQVVTVKILDVDRERGRVSLSMKALETAPSSAQRPRGGHSSAGAPPSDGGEKPRQQS